MHHLADAETVLYDRVRRVISRPKQVIWGFDPDAWNDGLDYQNTPLAINEKVYGSVRDSVINLADRYYDGSDKVGFVHSEAGVRTLKEEFEKISLHNIHHLKQIEKALQQG